MRWLATTDQEQTLRRRLALGAILILALGLRLYRLGDANLWWDEALAVWAVRKGLAGVTLWTASDVHPPLFFWSLWLWVQALGESEASVRLLPALFGVLTVFAVYQLGRQVADDSTGLLAALLTALARFHVWWSQELRMYVLAGLLGTLSLVFFVRWLRQERRPEGDSPARIVRTLVLYVLSTVGALYTIFLSANWLLVQNLIVLGAMVWSRYPERKRVLLHWLAAQVTVAALTALWVWFSWGRMSTWSVASSVSPGFVAKLYTVLLTSGVSVDIDRFLWATVLPLLATLAGSALVLSRAWHQRDATTGTNLATLVLSVLLPPVTVYLSTLPRSLFYTPHIEARYLLPFAPAFWTLLAWALSTLCRRWRPVGMALALGVFATWLVVLPGHYTGRVLHDDYQTMVRAIASQAEPDDVVLLDSGNRYPLFLYQYDQLSGERPPMESLPERDEPLTREQAADWLEENRGRHGRYWLAEVDVNLSDPDRALRQVLEEQYGAAWVEGYGHNTLLLFAPDEQAPRLSPGWVPSHTVEATSNRGQLTGLRGWDVPLSRYAHGDVLWVTLYWDTVPQSAPLLQVLNSQGLVIAGRRAGRVPEGGARERIALPITAAFPTGRFQIRLVSGSDQVILGSLRASGAPAHERPSGPEVPLSATLGGAIALRGYTVVGSKEGTLAATAGDEIVLDLYWEALSTPGANWTLFTHLVGSEFNPATQGPLWGQWDGMPGEGTWPTSTWQAGDVAVERIIIPIDPAAPAGTYTLALGLYDSSTGERAEIRVDGQDPVDQLVATTVVQVTAR
ncbi:MAG: hypothetical protein GXY79_00765 [Chloroflexi bacterium]|nr:hypothetical protein [Chloroflexota bacterium]